jgi:hypothetical protein
MYRQGDVLIIPTNQELPDKSELVPNGLPGRVVLAYGEATGHHHSLAVLEREVELYSSPATTDRFLKIMAASGAELVHQEHSTIALPPGTYIVRQQREWTDAQEPRRVAD